MNLKEKWEKDNNSAKKHVFEKLTKKALQIITYGILIINYKDRLDMINRENHLKVKQN